MTAPLCDQVRSRFDDYHDGLLAAAAAESIKGHLIACETCREEYGLLVSCIDVIRGLDAPAVPPRALRKIVDTLDRVEPGLDTP